MLRYLNGILEDEVFDKTGREWERRSKNAGVRPVERICRPALGMKEAGEGMG